MTNKKVHETAQHSIVLTFIAATESSRASCTSTRATHSRPTMPDDSVSTPKLISWRSASTASS